MTRLKTKKCTSSSNKLIRNFGSNAPNTAKQKSRQKDDKRGGPNLTKKRAKPNTGEPKSSVGLKTQEEAIPKQSEKRKPTVQEAMREKAAISATESPRTEKDDEPEQREDGQSNSSQRNRRHQEKKK